MNFSQRSILQNQNIHSTLHSPPTSRLILQLLSFLSFAFYLMINCQGPLAAAAAASHAQNKLTVARLTCDFLAGGYYNWSGTVFMSAEAALSSRC